MKNARFISGAIKCFLLVVFLYNVGVFGGLSDLLTQVNNINNKETSEAHEVLRVFMAEKIRNAERIIHTKKDFYSESRYHSDLADVFRKMEELELKPGLPNEINYLERLCYGKTSLSGKHGNVAKVIHRHEDIYEYFQSAESLVKKNELKNILPWLWKMYLKNFWLAFVFLLLECGASRRGFRNPCTFVLLLAVYPATIGFIFYRWFRLLGRSYIAEAELRRSKEKLFSLLSEDEIVQIRKFAEGSTSLRSWREGFAVRHAFVPALAVTIIISVIPQSLHAEIVSGDIADGSAVQIMQHLPRMDIESDDSIDDLDFSDRMASDFLQCICAFSFVKMVCGTVTFFITSLSPPEVLRKIDHVPLVSDVYQCNKSKITLF